MMARPDEPKDNFRTWAKKFLPHYFQTDSGVRLRESLFHRWMTLFVLRDLHLRRGQKRNMLAPRGASKTVWTTQAYPTYVAVHGLEKFIVLTADSGGQAAAYVASIRTELESNELLRREHPDAVRGMRCRDGRIILGNGCAIESSSTGSKIRGRKNGPHRPSLIVVDDPQNLDHISSELMRNRSWNWLMQDVCNAGNSDTNILVLGTALHRECIVCKLQQTVGWQTRTFQSIIEWPQRMDIWEGPWKDILLNHDNPDRLDDARRFFEEHREEMTA